MSSSRTRLGSVLISMSRVCAGGTGKQRTNEPAAAPIATVLATTTITLATTTTSSSSVAASGK